MWTRCIFVLLSVSMVLSATNDDKSTAKWITDVFKNATSSDVNKKPDVTAARDQDDNAELDLTPSNKEAEPTPTCMTANQEVGECVSYYLCDPDTFTIIEDGTTIIDIRSSQPCQSYLDVCCTHKKLNPKPFSTSVVSTTTPQPPIINNDNKRKTSALPADAKDSECGWEVPELFFFPRKDSLLYANYGEFPWAVAVMENKESNERYLGGGALIHPSVVISVAHKFNNKQPEMFKIRAGEWDTQTTKEMYPHQEREVKKIIIHPNFKRASAYYDVALLVLGSPVELAGAPHVRPACLGARLPPAGTVCYGMGWGEDFNTDGKYATTLKKIKLALVGSSDCTYKLQQSRLGPYFKLHESLTCAGGEEDVDTCEGDGGSSLVCPIAMDGNRTRYAVYGLVAFGLDCGVKNRPGVYANVPAVRDWVDRTMRDELLSTETYRA